MKKFQVALVLMFGLAGAAFAEDTKVPVPEPKINMQMVSKKQVIGSDVRVSPKDYPNGVVVRIKEMFGERPISASIFAEQLRQHGFKIAEKVEDADATFQVVSSTINFKDIDQSQDTIAARKIEAAAAIIMGAFATGGISLFATDYSNLGDKKPVMVDMSVNVNPTKSAGSPPKGTFVITSIKTDASSNKINLTYFEIMTAEWFKDHLAANDDTVKAGNSVSTAVESDHETTKQ